MDEALATFLVANPEVTGTAEHPLVLDAPYEALYKLAHVHTPSGTCVKNRFGAVCNRSHAMRLQVSAVDVNRLAQKFYEASGITLPRMGDKELVVRGLRAVFAELGLTVREDERVYPAGEARK